MRRKAGQGLSTGCREHSGDFNVYTLEKGRRHRDCCLMRSGEAENAMGARGNSGIAGGRTRRVLRILGIMQAQLERGSSEIGARRDRQAERDQQRLRGNGKGRKRADQRPPTALGTSASAAYADHVEVRSTGVIIGTAESKVNAPATSRQHSANVPSPRRRFTSAACA
jgi:hypothetical protein